MFFVSGKVGNNTQFSSLAGILCCGNEFLRRAKKGCTKEASFINVDLFKMIMDGESDFEQLLEH